MTRSKKSIAKLAIAIALIAGSAVGAATPSLARTAAANAVSRYYEPGDNGSAWSFYPGYADESTAQRTVDRTAAFNAHAEVRGPTHSGSLVDNPPGSAFQTQGNADSMGCPC